MSIVVAVLVAGGIAGAGAGVALDQSGAFGGDDSSTSVVAPGPVAYAACPDGTAVGTFHQDDRVYVTGRTKSSKWVEVRDPADLDQRVWVVRNVVVADDDLAGLPVHECTATGPAAAPTTTIAPGAPPAAEESTTTTTSTTVPGTPPTAPPAGGGGTTPTAPGDTTPPAINQAGIGPNPIYEATPTSGACFLSPSYKVVANASAVITDASGIASVTLSWDGPQAGSRGMSANGNSWSGAVGPFSASLPYGGQSHLTVTITAVDNAGNQSTAQLSLTVNACVLG
ncbi:MAG: hypothetical protein U0W40_00775 [Acidimicrobiia bacterium]